ncbi:MAG: flagellar basal body P-ring formation chaperone FlgA [Syntrophorhabdaceae bacterium]|nr:flagellar basal body P-ring formation chaperone FlgA [Syntrophorhabdaceae bacterium]
MRSANGIFLLILAMALFSPASAVASNASVKAALENYILSAWPWSDVEVRNLSFSAHPPEGAPEKITVNKGLPGSTVFTLKYRNGAVVSARADVEAYERIVVASRQLLKNSLISKDDVFLARAAIGRIPAGAVRDPNEIVGKVINRSVGPNLPVLQQYVAGSKIVKRGKAVILVAENGGVRVTTIGETRENAYINDAVKAVNIASKKTVTGILIDENTVLVSF